MTRPRHPIRGGTPGDKSQSNVDPAWRRFRGVRLIPLSGVGFFGGFLPVVSLRWFRFLIFAPGVFGVGAPSFWGGLWFGLDCCPSTYPYGGMSAPNTNPTRGETKTNPLRQPARGGSVGDSGLLPNRSPRGWLLWLVSTRWPFLGGCLFWVSPLVGLVSGRPPPWAVFGSR